MDLKEWLQLGSLIVAAAGFFTAVYQITNVVKGLRMQTYQRLYEVMIQIDRFFFEHPEFRKYFYPGLGEPPPEKDEERAKLLSIAEMMADFFDNVYHQRDLMPAQTYSGFKEYMRCIYHHSPHLRQHVSSNEKWYPVEFLNSLKQKPKDVC